MKHYTYWTFIWTTMSRAISHFPGARLMLDDATDNPVIFYRGGCLFVSVKDKKGYVSTQGAYKTFKIHSAWWLRLRIHLWLLKRYVCEPARP
jgi:hypothetical protein